MLHFSMKSQVKNSLGGYPTTPLFLYSYYLYFKCYNVTYIYKYIRDKDFFSYTCVTLPVLKV